MTMGDVSLAIAQNTSAGSAERSLRMASSAEIAHMNTVSASTITPRSVVMITGRLVASPRLRVHQQGAEVTGNKAQHRQDYRLCQYQPREEKIGIAYGFHGGVLAQVILHI